MRKIVLTAAVAMLFSCQGLSYADSSVDALIQKLEDKGILTDSDAAQLKDQIGTSEQASQQATFKSLLPDWLNSIKLTGDFRLRDQYQRLNVAGAAATSSSRSGYNRGRLRARINLEDQITDKIKVIVGIATNGESSGDGIGNSRSNNITFGGNSFASSSGNTGTGEDPFNKSTIVLNKAYAIYTPTSDITLEGGKMDNPIWEPIGGNSQLLWDPNITPEGGAVILQKKLNDYVTLFSTNTAFVLADNTPTSVGTNTAFRTDPYMIVTQDGIKGNLTDKLYYKGAVSYYSVTNPSRAVLGERPSTSTTTFSQGISNAEFNTNSTAPLGGQYLYGYYLIGGAVDIGMNDPFGELLPIYIPQVGIIGQYFQNQGAPTGDNAAWQMGAYIGNSAVNGWGTWKLYSVYKVLERDSWLDSLPDQDDYNGATDTAGWRTELDIGLAKNTWMALTYYDVNVYKDIPLLSQGSEAFSASAPYHMYQIDFNFKF